MTGCYLVTMAILVPCVHQRSTAKSKQCTLGGAPVGGKIFHFSSVFLGKFRTGFMNVEAYVPEK